MAMTRKQVLEGCVNDIISALNVAKPKPRDVEFALGRAVMLREVLAGIYDERVGNLPEVSRASHYS